MKKLILSLIIMSFSIVSCNNTLLLTAEEPAKLSVVTPSQMYLGDCTAWAVRLFSSNSKTARATEDTTINLSITSSGVSVPGAGLYSDSSCTQSISSVVIPADSVFATFYVKYNLVASLTVTGTSAGLEAGTNSITNSLSFRQVTKVAGAGEGWGNYEGVGSAARTPPFMGMATDGTYIYSTMDFQHQINRTEIGTRTYSKFAGLAYDSGSADGSGTAASFNNPLGLAVLNGYLYVADKGNHTIRRVNLSTQVVTTVAGSAGVAGHTDGVGSAARFSSPRGLTTDGTYIYISSDTHTIRRMDPSNFSVTTLAGVGGTSGTANGVGTAARFNKPGFLTTDGTYLYIPDTTNHTVRMLELATNTVTTLAGTAGASGSTDGTGAAARFNSPLALTYDSHMLYVADQNNKTIRKIDLSNSAVTTYLGVVGSSDDYAHGSFATTRMGMTYNVLVVGSTMYVGQENPVLTKVDTIAQTTEAFVGVAYNLAWSSLDGTGTNARFDWIDSLASDGTYVYIPDSSGHAIRRLSIATSVVDTIAGTLDTQGSTNGVGAAARFYRPAGLAISGTTLYVSEDGNKTIRKIDLTTNTVTTLAGSAGVNGNVDGTGSAARFMRPAGLALNGNDLYVCDYGARTIRKVNVTTGAVTTVAGGVSTTGVTDGVGTAARFRQPYACVVLGGYLYIGDYEAYNVRKMNLSTLEVTTVAGLADTDGFVDGVGTNARFSQIYGITSDGTSIYITDINNNAIRKLNPQTEEVTTLFGQGKDSPADRDSSIETATSAWPSGIVWTQHGLFFANDGIGISWVH